MGKGKFLDITSLEDGIARWQERLTGIGVWEPLSPEPIRPDASLDRITADAVFAKISSPFYHSSAMDGYAVNFMSTFGASETTPKSLVIGTDAVYVDTGDPLPDGFNAVIMIEDVNVVDGAIEIIDAVTPWKNVRIIGEDIVETELIIPQNQRIRPMDIGAMLAGGNTKIMVRSRPRVAVIPTGTEIVEPGTPLKRGDIIEYNSGMLIGMVNLWGGKCTRHPIVPDDLDLIKKAVEDSLESSDLIVIIAGSSMGSEDYTHNVIAQMGEVILHGLDIKPGKPVILGIIRNKPVIGIPGYPVSAYITFDLFAKPLLHAWQGIEGEEQESISATLSRQTASALGTEEFVRVKVGKVGGNTITTPVGRGAGLMMSLVRADGILRIPAMSEGIGAGAEVKVQLMRDMRDIENTIVSIGSHDPAMDILANCLRKHHPRLSLSSANVGSMGGLIALKKKETHIAPTHLLDESTGEYNVSYLASMLPGRKVILMNLVYREQGFMVPMGNPKSITTLRDLVRDDVTYINRQRGAGTRLLLDKCLKDQQIDPARVKGYNKEEYTHMAVASAVLTGVADTGLGVLTAANALGLAFVPIAKERYDLAIDAEYIDNPLLQALIGIIRGDREFREILERMGGYDTAEMGKIIWES